MPSFNTTALEFVNRAVGYYRPLDVFFVVATSYITLCFVSAALVAYFAIYLPWRQVGPERIKAFKNALYIGASVLITFILVEIIKVAVAFPRPFLVLKNLHVLISLPDGYSFPSGHAALTMALATSVYILRKRLGELLFAFAFVVGFARIYVGVHYPIDVGVGFLLGFFIPKIIAHFYIKKEPLTLQ